MNHAKPTLKQFTKREMQRVIRDMRVWIGLLAAGLIVGLMGPFDTDVYMRLVPRLVYWIFVVALSYFSGSAAAIFVSRWQQQSGLWGPIGLALAGVASGTIVLVELIALNWAIFGADPVQDGYLLALAANVYVISCVVTVAGHLLDSHATTPNLDTSAPSILNRLAFAHRGPLISMHVQDHYVEVFTKAGREMVLIRFSDAIAETVPTRGLQVHRSHWVALDQVTDARRDGAKAVLTMSDGRTIPVSRTYVPALKETGLLPS